jgi:hypothetical protein
VQRLMYACASTATQVILHMHRKAAGTYLGFGDHLFQGPVHSVLLLWGEVPGAPCCCCCCCCCWRLQSPSGSGHHCEHAFKHSAPAGGCLLQLLSGVAGDGFCGGARSASVPNARCTGGRTQLQARAWLLALQECLHVECLHVADLLAVTGGLAWLWVHVHMHIMLLLLLDDPEPK